MFGSLDGPRWGLGARFSARTHSAAAGLLLLLVHGLMKNGTPVQEEYGKWPINHRKREDSPLRSRALHLFQRTEAGFDGLARANLRFLRARWSVTWQIAQVASATKRRYPRGACACVLERLPQALARLVSDRHLHRDIGDRACLTDQ